MITSLSAAYSIDVSPPLEVADARSGTGARIKLELTGAGPGTAAFLELRLVHAGIVVKGAPDLNPDEVYVRVRFRTRTSLVFVRKSGRWKEDRSVPITFDIIDLEKHLTEPEVRAFLQVGVLTEVGW